LLVQINVHYETSHARENVPDVENAVKVECAVIFLVQIPRNVPEKYDVNVSIDLIREVARLTRIYSCMEMCDADYSVPVQDHRIRMNMSIARGIMQTSRSKSRLVPVLCLLLIVQLL